MEAITNVRPYCSVRTFCLPDTSSICLYHRSMGLRGSWQTLGHQPKNERRVLELNRRSEAAVTDS